MKSVVSCPICGSDNIVKKYQSIDFLVTKSSFDIMECGKCSTCITSPQPDPSEIDVYYRSEEYIAHSGKSTGIIGILYKTARFFTLYGKRKLIENEAGLRTGNILDIGCGSGEFLQACQKNGWNVTGIEPGELAREKASDLLGVQILETEDLFMIKGERFDVVTLWHVLEHVHDPNAVLVQVRNILNPGGVCLIAVPNHTSTDAKLYGMEWAAWDVPRHLYHFSPKAMNHLVSHAGMKLIASKWMPFDPFYVSLLTEKSVKTNGSLIRGIWTGLKSWFVSLFQTEKSSSLIYILKRNA